ncbi:hypothetical protein [Aestuariirhabdus sp. LZHN29]|uniref:hypothetical protein n=1 Tax=Aestuariirhabdus sp. LZHN29 TaxID=3417462 RepID=UPI003CF99A5F
MLNFINGAIATIILSLFLGGLAYSIWDNTGSISFPIIVGVVLIMSYVGFYEEIKSGDEQPK